MPALPPSQPEEVEALIEELRYAARAYRASPGGAAFAAGPDEGTDTAGPIDGYLAELWRRSQPRTDLPPRFRRFPLTIAPIRRMTLSLYNLLTREQRASNALLCDALRALQAALVYKERRERENSILVDYVRAQLKRADIAHSAVASSEGAAATRDSEPDEFLAALGERFRGTPELIRTRLKAYLPMVRDAGIAGPALDLGCGRGEWLELLRESDIPAIGVEHSRVLCDLCTRKGLQVVEADLAAFLGKSPDEHWQLVTAFHVIEHLGWPQWLAFMRDLHRVLRVGGMVIVETPNPGNVVTGANRFHLDPTHRDVIPSELLQFAATHVGFSRVDLLPLHAESEAGERLVAAGAPLEIVDRLFGPQDCALIARR